MLDLAGQWRLRSADGKHDVAYAVPGDVHSALIASAVIPHPYKGRKELECRWVADEDWVATRSFTLDAVEAGHYYLDIDNLDTVATVKVNGTEVLKADSCFRRHRPEVSAALRVGENAIEVTLHSNTRAANERQMAQPFPIPYHAGNCPIPNANMLRKPQCHFGWDWNLAIVPFGLCGRMELKRYALARIAQVLVQQDHNSDGSVDVDVRVTLQGDARAACLVSFAGETKAGGDARFHVAKPDLWWPAGQGDQHLYDLEVRCGSQVERRRIGLRKLELLTDNDGAGSRFAFRVNGREIFCKGANWILADALPTAATPELTRKLLSAAKDAHMNMIRVWGGGYYEKDFFYDICDELGLLVWQDFMFSCALYPSTDEFLGNVRREAQEQIARLQHHACIALWCGDNELLGALTWFEESRKNRDRYLVNYDRLNRALEEVVHQTDETAIWWPSSPSPGILDFGDTWHDDSKGDMHFWSVWHEGRDFEHYHDVRPRFCSEFGFQSFPSLRLIRDFAESDEDLNISSAVMEHHQRNKGGNARIAETLFRNFRFPMDFGNFVYLSQVQQGLAMRMAIEYWRSLKPHCMGTLYWQLNDTWPVASWSGLDHGGTWKLLHHMAQRFYAPVLVTACKDAKTGDLVFSAVNDHPGSITMTGEVRQVLSDGASRPVMTLSATVPSTTAIELARLAASDVNGDGFYLYSWSDSQGGCGRNHFSPKPYKHMVTSAPGLVTAASEIAGQLSITLTVQRPAWYVALSCDVAGHFSGNGFDLLPGENISIIFTPENPSDLERAAASLMIRDLHSSSH